MSHPIEAINISNDWQVCAEFGRLLQAGTPCRAEDFIRLFPRLFPDSDAAIDLIYEEYTIRSDLFQAALIQELIRRFPQWQAQLQTQFAVHDALMDTVLDGPIFPDNQVALPAGVSSCDRFEIYQEIGRGRFSRVHLAWDKERNHAVAIKTLSPDMSITDTHRQLQIEVEAHARIRHPNIVALLDFGDKDGRPFLVLEYVDGVPLSQHLEGRPMPIGTAVGLAIKLAVAVDHIHRNQTVHGDLSPANILLRLDGEPKIADFGFARFLNQHRQTDQRGVIFGTPSYMAPEQAAGHGNEAGPLVDVYGLGAVLYHMLTGHPPFLGRNAGATLSQILSQDVIPVRQRVASVPAAIESACLRCLHKDPDRRYPDAISLANDLRTELVTSQ